MVRAEFMLCRYPGRREVQGGGNIIEGRRHPGRGGGRRWEWLETNKWGKKGTWGEQRKGRESGMRFFSRPKEIHCKFEAVNDLEPPSLGNGDLLGHRLSHRFCCATGSLRKITQKEGQGRTIWVTHLSGVERWFGTWHARHRLGGIWKNLGREPGLR